MGRAASAAPRSSRAHYLSKPLRVENALRQVGMLRDELARDSLPLHDAPPENDSITFRMIR
jgi:hypothetical protein